MGLLLWLVRYAPCSRWVMLEKSVKHDGDLPKV